MGNKQIKKSKPEKKEEFGFIELKGKDLEKFEDIMKVVNKDLIIAKRKSRRMAHEARIASANAILNY